MAQFLKLVLRIHQTMNTMKKIMLLAACTTMFTAANAQISFAPEVGLNLANMHSKYKDASGSDQKLDDGIKLGAKAGINVNIPVADRVVIQPGIFYSTKGMKSEEDNETHNVTLHTIDVPVNIQYMFNDPSEGRFFVGVGPYLGVFISGKDIYAGVPNGTTTTSGTTDFKFGNDYPSNDLRRFDVGGQANVGYLLRSGLFFRGTYQQSFTNLTPQGNQPDYAQAANFRTRPTVITISIGKQFGGTPKSKGPRMQGSTPTD
jgi:hypothetical protein